MSRGTGLFLTVAGAVLLVFVAVRASAPTPSPVPAPSPVAVVSQVESPANLVLADGRRVHVSRMNGSPPVRQCETDADMVLASQLVAGRTVAVAPARLRDFRSTPPGYTDVDLRVDGGDYADTWTARQGANRGAACPLPSTILPPVPPTESAPDGDTYVELERDDDETRFCARRWWC